MSTTAETSPSSSGTVDVATISSSSANSSASTVAGLVSAASPVYAVPAAPAMSPPSPSPTQVFLSRSIAELSVLQASAPPSLLAASDALVQSFHQHVNQEEGITMLPSYTYQMPDGSESGTSVAVDLGGSTLRAAVVRLYSRARRSIGAIGHRPFGAIGSGQGQGQGQGQQSQQQHDVVHKSFADVKCRRSWVVDDTVKRYSGVDFFDWITERIAQVLELAGEADGRNMSLGLTWSFPIDLTSLASGNVKQMGKGYEMWAELAGTDLKTHFEEAFTRRGLRLRMTALMNDTEATLLSHAHTNPSTRISLIWGTGLNAAVQLPVSAIGPVKLTGRPQEWTDAARAALVNTEVSIFGSGILPLTAADRALDAASNAPGFQPLEQMTSGRYLGEVVRLTLVDGVKDGLLFAGDMPRGLDTPWAFGTDLMSDIERATIAQAGALLTKRFGFTLEPSLEDVYAVQRLALAVSERAAILVAITLFSLWRMQRDAFKSDDEAKDAVLASRSSVAISYCGAVAEKHCTARDRCQAILDTLIEAEPLAGGEYRRRLILEQADDSGLLGAAVAAVINKPDSVLTRNRSISRL